MKRGSVAPKIVKVLRTAALLLVAGSSLSVAYHTHSLCEGVVPENNMKIPVGFKSFAAGAAGLDKAAFDAVIDRVERVFKPVFAQAGGTLEISRFWSDPTVNAYADRKGGAWMIGLYGGLARHPAITVEGFAFVVCHEIGHHIGGAPKTRWGRWHTNEGGSDYYAALKCLREFFVEDDSAPIVKKALSDGRLTKYAVGICDQQFPGDSERLVCKRTAMAGMSFARFLNDFPGSVVPDFETPDPGEVTFSNDYYPSDQCRLDTIWAGGLCDVDTSVALSDTDYRQGSCVQNVAKLGFRPRCWFKP